MLGEQSRVEDQHLTQMETLVTSHTGLRLRPRDRETLRRAAMARVKQLGLLQAEEYLRLLGTEREEAKAEWRQLVSFLTNPESHYFRDHALMTLLRDTLLPELIARSRPRMRLRLWSAGCSRGQEPYSLAILVQQLIPDWRQWDLSIVGTDINEEYLGTARRGIYSDWSFRSLDPVIRERYFRPVPGGYQIDESLRSLVTFRDHNLVGDACPDAALGLQELDLILCRNVFIYFAPESIRLVLPRLAAALREGGYLITGHAEVQSQWLELLEARLYPEAMVYQRIGAGGEEGKGGRGEGERGRRGAGATRQRSICPLTPSPLHPFTPSPPHPFTVSPRVPGTAGLAEAEAAIREGQHGAALEMLERRTESGPARYRAVCLLARIYANQGELERASELCRRAVSLDPLGAMAYQLLASIAEERGNRGEARELLRKVIYLDPEGPAAFLELAGIYASEGDATRAGKLRRTALALLRALPPAAAVEPWGDVTAGELLRHVEERADGGPADG
jgi:chemotaxis protein methyltransferase CheR